MKLLALLTVVFALGGNSFASAEDSMWAICNKQGELALQLGDLPKALKSFERGLREAEDGYDPGASKIISLTNLALVYSKSGDKKQAETLLRRALAEDPKSNQEMTRSTARALATVLYDKRDYLNAEKMLLRASTDFFPPQSTMLAMCYLHSGQKEKASDAIRCTIASEHLNQATFEKGLQTGNYLSLANSFQKSREERAAAPILEYLLNESRIKNADEEGEIVQTLCAYYLDEGMKQDARALLLRQEKKWQQATVPQTATAHIEKAFIQLDLREKNYREAARRAAKLTAIYENKYGLFGQQTCDGRDQLADYLRQSKQNNEVEQLWKNVMAKADSQRSAKNEDYVNMLSALASSEFEVGHTDEAIRDQNESLKLRAQLGKPQSAVMVSTYLHVLGAMYAKAKRYDEADKCYKRAIAIWEDGKNEQGVMFALVSYQQFLASIDRVTEANSIQQRVDALFQKHEGPCHGVFLVGVGVNDIQITKW